MILTYQNVNSVIGEDLVSSMAGLSDFVPPENFSRAVFVMDMEDASVACYFKRFPSEYDLQFDTRIKRFIRDRLNDEWQLSLYTFVESFDEIRLHNIHFVYDIPG